MELKGTNILGGTNALKKAKGLYVLKGVSNRVSQTQLELISEIDFGEPLVKLSGSVSFKLTYSATYKATYVSPNLTTNTIEVSSGSSAGGNLIDESVSHSVAGNCEDDLPNLKLSGIYVGNNGGFSSGRLRFERETESGVANTTCNAKVEFELIFALGNRTILDTNLDKPGSGWDSLTLKEL